MEAEFQRCIKGEQRSGRTVLLSSHILAEVEALCDRLSIIRAGRTVETGTLAELRHLTRTAVRAELTRAPDTLMHELAQLGGVTDLKLDGLTLTCQVEGEQVGPLLSALTPLNLRALTARAAHAGSAVFAALPDRPAPTPGTPGMNGLSVLLKLMLRRERLALPLWLLAFPLAMVANLISTHKLYATPEVWPPWPRRSTARPPRWRSTVRSGPRRWRAWRNGN